MGEKKLFSALRKKCERRKAERGKSETTISQKANCPTTQKVRPIYKKSEFWLKISDTAAEFRLRLTRIDLTTPTTSPSCPSRTIRHRRHRQSPEWILALLYDFSCLFIVVRSWWKWLNDCRYDWDNCCTKTWWSKMLNHFILNNIQIRAQMMGQIY